MRTVILALLLTACGAGMHQGRQASRIERDELSTVQGRDAYEAVERLRPLWLDVRMPPDRQGEAAILVYVDGVRFGEVEVLKDIPLVNVESMRVMNSAELTALVGTEDKFISRIIAVRTRVRDALAP